MEQVRIDRGLVLYVKTIETSERADVVFARSAFFSFVPLNSNIIQRRSKDSIRSDVKYIPVGDFIL